MRRWLADLRVSRKLALMLVAPVLGVLALAGMVIADRLGTASDAARVERMAGFAVAASALVHELQKERGLTSGFLGSEGRQFRTELPRQRALVDARRRALTDVAGADPGDFGSEVAQSLGAAERDLAGLVAHRRSVDGLTAARADSTARYTSPIEHLLAATAALPRASGDGQIATSAAAYVRLLQAKERMGRERATLNGAL
ncbi:MAG: nitrate- and nitrite sensing domain-containing protein, partial [Thermoleophilia bacterium]|nr:nitrate- and nitrite sensing domain-containing protein [Thermoleophilia bacterium]